MNFQKWGDYPKWGGVFLKWGRSLNPSTNYEALLSAIQIKAGDVKFLEEVVNKLSSTKKQKVKQSFFKTSRSFELTVCDGSLAYLKPCAFPAFHKLLFDLFRNNPDDDFLKWPSKNLEIRIH